MRQLTGVQTEATITHPSLPKLHLKRCMVGRLTLRCQSLETLEMQSSTVTNLHIQCPQLRYCPACASLIPSLPLAEAPVGMHTEHVACPCADAGPYSTTDVEVEKYPTCLQILSAVRAHLGRWWQVCWVP